MQVAGVGGGSAEHRARRLGLPGGAAIRAAFRAYFGGDQLAALAEMLDAGGRAGADGRCSHLDRMVSPRSRCVCLLGESCVPSSPHVVGAILRSVGFLTWLLQNALGPALFGLPVTGAAAAFAGAARRWFERLRRDDGLSRIVQAAVGSAAPLSDAEFVAVRDLLLQEETWIVAGRGTVEDLAVRVGRCLNRADEEALMAGRAIAAGILEFAVRDLEPELFKRVLFARLERLEARKASRLDVALFTVHADLAAQLAARESSDRVRFAEVTGTLSRVLDRLPPGPAERGEVALYLVRLAWWLNVDPWPQDVRFVGYPLTPADVEQRLQITSKRSGRGFDADDLCDRCTRLVVLGGSGMGKTWLAWRAARRCALFALDRLADGASLDEVELPLFANCARLSSMPKHHEIRRAVVECALSQLPDLGSARVTEALRAMFQERRTRVLLVLDSLDEASGAADDRVSLADTLPRTWRIILTSRPAAWNGQLPLKEDDGRSHVIGDLQQLRYPQDVESFIARWFTGRPERAEDISSQIRSSRALQQAAAVPLILAFYCIIGDKQSLPVRRAELYAKVINRMVTGRWRDRTAPIPDLAVCMRTLREWAWSAASSRPVSGTGTWADEIRVALVRGAADSAALDHVAVPLPSLDPDSNLVPRRFAHRSIQEYLVASHIAQMPTEDAAAELFSRKSSEVL